MKAVAFGADIASKYAAEVLLVQVLLRGELAENLRHMAEVEHLVAEGGRPLTEALSAIPRGRWPIDAVVAPEGLGSESRMLQAVAEQILDLAESEARQHGAQKMKRIVLDGDPVNRILETAETEKVDLIVTGARGLSDIKSLMVGSVSHKLTHLSPVTCVTVR
jgi:nucleotide-binding universal stress UspA family protein